MQILLDLDLNTGDVFHLFALYSALKHSYDLLGLVTNRRLRLYMQHHAEQCSGLSIKSAMPVLLQC